MSLKGNDPASNCSIFSSTSPFTLFAAWNADVMTGALSAILDQVAILKMNLIHSIVEKVNGRITDP